MLNANAFLQATRPRTYQLAMVGIFAGNATAFTLLKQQHIAWTAHHWQVFALSLWIALALQILSNLANDYGNGIKGIDDHHTHGKTRHNIKFLNSLITYRAIYDNLFLYQNRRIR